MNELDCNDGSASQRANVMNSRAYNRNIPSQPLQPYLDSRPVLTKYSIMPIVDPRREIKTPLIQQATYNPEQIFNPGNDFAPWSGYASNVNRESELRNQIYALQKCSQSAYVPNSNSDLYDYKFQSIKQHNPHELLFQNESFSGFNPNPDQKVVGSAMFMNNTRVQVRDMTKQTC